MPITYAPDRQFVLRLIVGCKTVHGGTISVNCDMLFVLALEPYPPAPVTIIDYYNTVKLLVSRTFPNRLQAALAFRTMQSRVGGGKPWCVAMHQYVSQSTGATVADSDSDNSDDAVMTRSVLHYTKRYNLHNDADRVRVVALQQIWRLQQEPKYTALDAVRHVPGLVLDPVDTAFVERVDRYESVASASLSDFSGRVLEDVLNKQDNLLYAELALRRVLRARCGLSELSRRHWLFPTEEPSLEGVAESILHSE